MQFYISHSKQMKRNFHNCIEIKEYNLDVIKCCYVMLCYVKTSSLAGIQALDLLLIHSQKVNWIITAQINPRHEKMQRSFYINQFHLWNNSMFLETICFFYSVHVSLLVYLFSFICLYLFKKCYVNCFKAYGIVIV